jgi:hypothetical protein
MDLGGHPDPRPPHTLASVPARGGDQWGRLPLPPNQGCHPGHNAHILLLTPPISPSEVASTSVYPSTFGAMAADNTGGNGCGESCHGGSWRLGVRPLVAPWGNDARSRLSLDLIIFFKILMVKYNFEWFHPSAHIL